MAIEITLPRLGWSMEEGVFQTWLKKEGDEVSEGEALFVLESDKAAQEVEAADSGILHIPQDSPKPGETTKVGRVLGYLLAPGEKPPGAGAPPAQILNLQKNQLPLPRKHLKIHLLRHHPSRWQFQRPSPMRDLPVRALAGQPTGSGLIWARSNRAERAGESHSRMCSPQSAQCRLLPNLLEAFAASSPNA